MVESNFPSATFGKPPGATAYQIINQHEAFEDPVVAKAFRTICFSFEWKPSSGRESHRPCFGLINCDGGILIARYTDAGRDLTGRPHTMRIECLLANAESAARAWSSLARNVALPTINDKLQIVGKKETFARS